MPSIGLPSPSPAPFLAEEEYVEGVPGGRRKKVMFVFVVGGLTFLEIAALRYLSTSPSFPFTILIGTTALVNGNTFLDSLCHR
jgi:vacuolar protein sorting-associated protein 33A